MFEPGEDGQATKPESETPSSRERGPWGVADGDDEMGGGKDVSQRPRSIHPEGEWLLGTWGETL